MDETIEIDLTDDMKDGTDKFFQLLDPDQWEVLKAKLDDPSNEKSIAVLIGELLDGY